MLKTPEEFVCEFLDKNCWDDYREFFDAYVTPLLRIHGTNFGRQVQFDAEDCLRGDFYFGFCKWDRTRPLKPWLSQVVRNCLLDCAKSSNVHRREHDLVLASNMPAPQLQFENREREASVQDAFWRVFERLYVRDQEIVKVLFPMIFEPDSNQNEEMSVEAVALKFGIRPCSVYQIKCRFRRDVERELERR